MARETRKLTLRTGYHIRKKRDVQGIGQEKEHADKIDPSNHPRKILPFEGLRGLMALLVCMGHLGLNTIAGKLGLQIRFELAVDVFFALSGFVLIKQYYLGRRTFGRLFIGRIARLYPLHALTLIWMVGMAWVNAQPMQKALLFQNVLLIQNIGLPPNFWAFNFPSWSISVEMVVSLAFYFVTRKTSTFLPILLAVIGMAIQIHELSTVIDPAANHVWLINSGLLRGFAGFCIGCSSYLVIQRWEAFFQKLRLLAPAMLLILLCCFFNTRWSGFEGILVAAIFSSSLMLFLGASALVNGRSLLATRPLVYLGAISYSIYLLHIPILITMVSVMSDATTRQTGKLFVLAVILAASAVCHQFYEMPMQRLVLGLIHSSKKASARFAGR